MWYAFGNEGGFTMPTTKTVPNTSAAAIFGRMWEGRAKMSATVAKQVLKLGFSDADKARMHQLAKRSSDGTLTAAEGEEYDGYILVGAMLAIIHSKARMALKLPLPSRKQSA